MFERTFTVKFLSLKKCFCYISDKQTRAIDQGSYVKVTYDRNVFYFTVGGFLGNLKENEVGINGVYAKALGLKEKDLILFSLCNKPIPGTKTLNIIPNNKDDYEILELMAENVQSTLLDQLRVVNNNQKIVIWISNSIHTIVNVDGVTPWSPGRLDHLTEVVIKPPVAKRAKTPAKEEATSRASPWTANGFLKRFAREERATPDRYEGICVPFVFRLHPSDDVADNNGDVFTVYARKGSLPFYARRADLFFYLRPIAPPKDFKYPDDGEERKEIGVKLVLLDGDEEKGWDCCKPLFVDEAIFNHYGLSKGSKVVLRSVKKFGDVEKIEINAEKIYVREIREKFKLFVGDNATNNRKILLNSDFVMNISDAHRVVLKFAPIGVTCCLLDGDFIRNGNLSINEIELPNIPQNNTNKNDRDIYTNLANFNQILNDCRKCLELGYEDVANLENILIVGKPGSGKSTIAQEFANRVSQSPTHFYVETISCKSIKGKAADSLQKYFETKFSKLVYYQPSVLILDDLNVICERVQDGEEPTQQNLLFNRASEITANFLDDILKNHFVQVIATSESTLKLNKRVFDSRGVHFFKNIFAINELGKSDRMGLLKFTFEKETKLDDDVDLENLSLKTEGYVAQDLTDLVHRCVFEALKEDLNTVKSEHCERALGASSSLSLRNVQLHAPGEKDFSDIGGLDDVKKVLVESMLWPAKYANIFANAPLRLQSGLLLYGPPGTGKTILAGAAAKQCNLRLISIKGPELLSKYIGASEQAVRDVFEKAQSAKPCILFFDEFDSLAPRRGHDNTGVTDRVVNQFLTQLDGVESLTGVCVLAATSRPDLLDPALLRPGRLDRQILCPLPDPVSRLAIVRSLAKGLRLADDVDLEEIARRTEGFSGADLQAVLYTAQLSSVEYLLDEEAREDVDVETEITRGHLEEALRTTRPSLTTEDRRKYDRIYAKFQANEDLLDLQAGKQRTTLA